MKDFSFNFGNKMDELEQLKKENIELKKQLETLKANPRGEIQKKGMVAKAVKGNLMSRAPFGYRIENKKLVPAENHKEIEEIFEEFLHNDTSLRKQRKRIRNGVGRQGII